MFGLDRLEGFSSAMVDATERLVDEWDDGEEIVINESLLSALSLLSWRR